MTSLVSQLLNLSWTAESGTIIILKHVCLFSVVGLYLFNYKKAARSDIVAIVWIAALSFIEWYLGIGYVENYKVFLFALAIQCHFHYDRSSTNMAFYTMKKSGSADSLKHWAMVVIPYSQMADKASRSQYYRIYHAVGELSQLQFKSTKITKSKLAAEYADPEFVTVIDRGDLLDFTEFEAKTPFALGTGTCQDFCLYFSQALSNNLMRCYLRMFSSKRIMVKAHITIYCLLQAILLSEGVHAIVPVDLLLTVMISIDFYNATRLYQSTPVYLVANFYLASLEMILIITAASVILNVFKKALLLNWFAFILVVLGSSWLMHYRDNSNGLKSFHV